MNKKVCNKRGLMFENYIDSLFNDKIILKSQQVFRSDHHNVCTVEINKIALSGNDDKGLQTSDRVTTYPYEKNAIKVCQSEMMIVKDFFVKSYADCPFYDEIMLQRQRQEIK